jgi:hypothetical protein
VVLESESKLKELLKQLKEMREEDEGNKVRLRSSGTHRCIH